MTGTVVSLRKFSRIAPGLTTPVQIRYEDEIIGAYTPAPRSVDQPAIPADETTRTGASRIADESRASSGNLAARPSGAPAKRAASEARNKTAPAGVPEYRPAPKPGRKP